MHRSDDLRACAAQEAESIVQAKAAAAAWPVLVDAGNYSAIWQEAAGLFQSAVTPQSWASAVQAARAPRDSFQSREVESATYTRTLPGVPNGQYVVIKYASKFAGKANAVETVTPLKEKSATWRVSGYIVLLVPPLFFGVAGADVVMRPLVVIFQ